MESRQNMFAFHTRLSPAFSTMLSIPAFSTPIFQSALNTRNCSAFRVSQSMSVVHPDVVI